MEPAVAAGDPRDAVAAQLDPDGLRRAVHGKQIGQPGNARHRLAPFLPVPLEERDFLRADRIAERLADQSEAVQAPDGSHALEGSVNL